MSESPTAATTHHRQPYNKWKQRRWKQRHHLEVVGAFDDDEDNYDDDDEEEAEEVKRHVYQRNDEEAEWEHENGVTLASFMDLDQLRNEERGWSASASNNETPASTTRPRVPSAATATATATADPDVAAFFKQFEAELGVEQCRYLVDEFSAQGLSKMYIRYLTSADLTKYHVDEALATRIAEAASLVGPPPTSSPVFVSRAQLNERGREHSDAEELQSPSSSVFASTNSVLGGATLLSMSPAITASTAAILIPHDQRRQQVCNETDNPAECVNAMSDLDTFFVQFSDKLNDDMRQRLVTKFARQGLTNRQLRHLKPHDLTKYGVDEATAQRIAAVARQTADDTLTYYSSPPSAPTAAQQSPPSPAVALPPPPPTLESAASVLSLALSAGGASEADDEGDGVLRVENEFQALTALMESDLDDDGDDEVN